MPQSLAHIALVVRDYDEAIAWFTGKLGFALVADEYQAEQDKRWVLVAPRARAQTPPPSSSPAPPRPSRRPSSATRPAAASSCS
jgi:catechol 2,3-dioxygenase-like lactoylglutathione lyase family enzyme